MTASMVPPAPAVTFENVTVIHPGKKRPALNDINVRISPGSSVAIVGPNGAGKTTFFNAALGLVPLSRGTIRIFHHLPRLARRRIAYMPQRDNVNWQFPLTALDVVLMGRIGHVGWRLRPRGTDVEAAERALDAVGMIARRTTPIGELSGGQQQRVMLARALAQNAPILFLDEPFNEIDLTTRDVVVRVLNDLAADGRTLIVTTHDLAIAKTEFSHALFLNTSVQAFGPTATTFTEAMITRTFLHKGAVSINDDR